MEYLYDNLKYLAVALPEDILKEKWSGNFDGARALIDQRLTEEIPYGLRCRLEFEYRNLRLLEHCYRFSEEEGLKIMQESIPDFTKEELDQLLLEGKIDWIYLNGKKMFLRSFRNTLLKVYPALRERAGMTHSRDFSVLEELVEELEDGQEMKVHLHIRQDIFPQPHAVREGKIIRGHIPVPVERDQVKNLQILKVEPEAKRMPQLTDPQATTYFEEVCREGQIFTVEYEFDHVADYIDLSNVDLSKVEAAEIPEDAKAFLCEDMPHVQFTPYLKNLTEEIIGDETNPLVKARLIYDFITTKIEYAFMREYACIDNITEYCAQRRRGDCGVQALLFITLCRIAGIPARWQSGLDAKPGDVGQHDWARFYVPSVGWVYADLSYGGASKVNGNEKLWNFFFGNLDPYRVPINDEFQRDFVPAKKYARVDPYDNQSGELEYEDYGLETWEIDHKFHDLGIRRVK